MTTTTHDSSMMEQPPTPLGRLLSQAFTLRWETAVYLVILLLAIFTRFYILGDRVMSHDESLHTKFSYDLYSQGIYQHTPLMHGPILFHATALMYALFGDNDFTARIYPAVLGIALVMFPILFRRWLGRWGAVLAAVMILVSPLLLYYNRYIRHDTPSIFFTMVMVYCTFMYLDGPTHLRRRTRWLLIFSGAMLGNLGSKEVAFIYIAIFGSFLTLYWVVRLAQHFWKLPGKTLMYFLSVSILLGGIAALGMYVVLSISPLPTALAAGPGTLAYLSLVNWTLIIVVVAVFVIFATMLWANRGRLNRIRWLDITLVLLIALVTCAGMIIIEERSHVSTDASQTAAPVVPGEEGLAEVAVGGFQAWPIIAVWVISLGLIAALIYSVSAGWWRTLHRFPELDILMLMGTFILPWLTPFVVRLTGITAADYVAVADAAPAFIKSLLPVTSSQEIGQTLVALQALVPMLALAAAAGMAWNWKRWLACAGVFYVLYIFFFTTMFTNMRGLAGMYTSLDYWLEQQGVRRGNQPQYYYLLIILPFYEFLPIIGSILAMFSGLAVFWRFRNDQSDNKEKRYSGEMIAEESASSASLLPDEVLVTEEMKPDELPPHEQDSWLVGSERTPKRPRDLLKRVPFLLFVSWWAIFNLVAYTLSGEKMPWLGTHMTLPLILLSAWYFGGILDKVHFPTFRQRGWLYLLFLPLLYVGLAQVIGPFIMGTVLGGLTQQDLTRAYQWYAGILVAGIALVGIYRLLSRTGWAQLRQMAAAALFIVLSIITFRSAWIASFINYDLANEFLVYAHAAPANKWIINDLEEISRRITGGMDAKVVYDYKISWPGSWYFRLFSNAVYAGENPNPRVLEDAVAVVVGDENRSTVDSILEDRYYRVDYTRLWWPMQDYFGLTPERIINTFDFTPENIQAAQIRQGLFDIWWSRDYKPYGDAVGKTFEITSWPLSDKMYLYVRKDIAAQIWDLGAGEGVVVNPLEAQQVNTCTTTNWEPRGATLLFDTQTNPLNTPRGVAVSPDGRVYVAEEFNHRISVYTTDGRYLFSFGQRGTEPGPFFERPNAIAIGATGTVYVADTWNFRIQVFTADGEYITSWGQRGEFGQGAQPEPFDGFWGPRAVALDSQENVYVADTGNKRVRVYTKDGQYIRDIGSGGGGNGQLDEPAGLAISSNGLLYVADTWNQRISVFTLDGSPANLFATSSGASINNFRVRGWRDDLGNRPYLTLDAVRNWLYVTDPDAGRVLIYDLAGNCVASFGQPGRENPDSTQFAVVGGISADATGNLYISDSGSGRVLKFLPYDLPLPEIDTSAGGGGVEQLPPVGEVAITEEVESGSGDEAQQPAGVEATPEVEAAG